MNFQLPATSAKKSARSQHARFRRVFPDAVTERICRESIARERERFEKELAVDEQRMKRYRLRERLRAGDDSNRGIFGRSG
jgi:hypothetical protein